MASTRLTIDEQARALGHTVWLERRCFEVLGGWVRSTDDAAGKVELAAASRHHGEHAQALECLLPATRDHQPAALVGPADDGWPARIDEWAAATSAPDRRTASRALLGATVESHTALLGSLSSVADAPAIRVLRSVVDDERRTLEHDSAGDGGPGRR